MNKYTQSYCLQTVSTSLILLGYANISFNRTGILFPLPRWDWAVIGILMQLASHQILCHFPVRIFGYNWKGEEKNIQRSSFPFCQAVPNQRHKLCRKREAALYPPLEQLLLLINLNITYIWNDPVNILIFYVFIASNFVFHAGD